ncbi:MAG TPA: hypothetical protein VN777_18175 [Terriglobales bacterium]|nr:hypothetical protein [Terriglobales bacterium]
MSNYLLNLGVSTTAQSNGSFQADNGNANPLLRSCVWLEGGAQLSLSNNFYQISQALSQTDWAFIEDTADPLSVDAGDIVLVRVFQVSVQATPVPKLVLNAVFGQGSSTETAGSGPSLQSPLSVNGQPRTVIDSFQLAFTSNPQQQQQYWSAPNPADGSWTFCLGAIGGADNTYSFNAGALLCTNPPVGAPIFQFGLDPRVKVGMGAKGSRERAA